ncbi:MAG: NAD-dependent succinate-semialdehyde dehydrogenase [Alphaproteobacteria bacterium]|nr:NAD-dependent succinate-semialdehyde dehydrogenase [Alphaproteobacteria bacterium]MCB9974704.1 NAD-dependent succinate-semialdehyde dehydrogenase [Rhodospirillales bacterium]
MSLKSINPASGKVLATFEPYNDAYIAAAVELSEKAFYTHRQTGIQDRAEKMRAVAALLESHKERHALTITREMGKTLASARAEVEKCALGCRFYADNAARFLEDQFIKMEGAEAFVRYLPLGPLLAIMPWNFPYWQVFRFAAPAIMAGNTVLLKHASNVPQCALAIEDVFREAGLGEGVFQILLIGSDQVGQLIDDSRVRGVTLTGSEGAGRAVASRAALNIKKTVLELGGSDAFIVMPSADIDHAVSCAVTGRIQNAGQSCIAAKRFIIHSSVYEVFREKMIAAFESLKVGDPEEEGVDLGPLSSAQAVDDLEALVEQSIEAGAVRVCGAKRIEGEGFFFRPGLLEDIPREAPAYSEELFGPVGLLFAVGDLDDAVLLANDTRFGLGSAIFTTDQDEMERAINGLEAGATFVNKVVASDPRLPFGGVKASGYGRELAEEGIREFMNIKTVVSA